MTRFPDDPFAKREQESYENPIASREYIIDYLKQQPKPVTKEHIASAFALASATDEEALRRRLNAMVRDGQLHMDRRDRYSLIEKMDLITGTIIAHRDGYGFLRVEGMDDDLYLSAREMQSVIHGDKVSARIAHLDDQGRGEARIVEILSRELQQIVGRFCYDRGIAYVIPENPHLHQPIVISPDATANAQENQIVCVQLLPQARLRDTRIGQITRVLGNHMDPGMEIEIAIRTHQLPYEWPAAVKEAVRHFTSDIPESALSDRKSGRKDLRDKSFVTIDGEDARDFDDAVYCEPQRDGSWRLWVAIADVSYYVKPGQPLDNEAQERGTSVYFPGQVIPMLPEILSNDLCSLKPKIDRLCLVSECHIDAQGQLIHYEFYHATIHSKARLTYTQVALILEESDGAMMEQCAPVIEHLYHLHSLFTVLLDARLRRGAIDFPSTETKIIFGQDKKIEKIIPAGRNVAHRIIEECMLTANVSAALFLLQHKVPALYRVHDKPDAQKIIELRKYLGTFGLQLEGGDNPTPRDYLLLTEKINVRDDAAVIQTMLLRSMSQAVYSVQNIGHFGLAYDAYTHFTSPIRRYPDLIVHRAISSIVEKTVEKTLTSGFVKQIAEHCSMTERRADEASRDVTNWLKCEFMQDKVGETFPGIVSGVTSFGLFVQLQDIFIDGLVHISTLPSDFYHYEPARQALVGEHSGRKYHLGDSLSVRVARVDLSTRKIDFDLVETDVEKSAGKASTTKNKANPKKIKKKKDSKSG